MKSLIFKIITFTYGLAFLISCTSCHDESMNALIDRVFDLAKEQYTSMADSLDQVSMPKTYEDGKLVRSNITWWCSGFYPGALWYIYEYTKSDAVKTLAEEQTMKVEPIKEVTRDHDVGFQINCSFGNGYRLTGNEYYKEVMQTAANSLSTRFNENVGCTRSWDWVKKGRSWKFPVIIDNMMNLELLLETAVLYDNHDWRDIAVSHATTTMRNHFRKDFSCYHLVDYDPDNGDIRSKETVQGFDHASSWSRGQGWALYSYAMMYRYTQNEDFLNHAEHIADMIVKRLPDDGIPFWDFDAPDIPNALKDASAAAVMASGFIELSNFTKEQDKKECYITTAEKQLRTLAGSEYLAKPGENGCFILKHSVGNLPGNAEVDVPLTYADYYFLEALIRYSKYTKKLSK